MKRKLQGFLVNLDRICKRSSLTQAGAMLGWGQRELPTLPGLGCALGAAAVRQSHKSQ